MEYAVKELTQQKFLRAFISSLVELGQFSIRPQHVEDRKGFARVIDVLNGEVQKAKLKGPNGRDWYKQLVRLKNSIQPSNNGSYDNFETALRDLQMSITNCPNPFYEFISLEMSPPFARTTLEELSPEQREVAKRAAQAFLEKTVAA